MATSVVKPGFGTLIQMKIPAGGSYTTIAEVTALNGVEITKDFIDVTHMESPTLGGGAGNSPVGEMIGSIIRLGQMTLGLNFLPANASHQALYEQGFTTNTPDAFRIIWKGDNTTTPVYPWIFNGLPSSINASAEVGGKADLQVSIQLTDTLTLP